MQGDSKVVERRRADAGKTHPESIHTKAEGHCKEQRRGRTVHAAALETSEAKGVERMMCDLGFAVKPVLALRVRRVKSEENVADLGTKPLNKAVVAEHCLTLGYANMDEENV